MKIALLGYGKMGKSVEQAALQKGHEIVLRVSNDIDRHALKEADVAIDFSIPKVAFRNITACLDQGVPVVSGTTGWLNQYDEAVAACKASGGAFLYASNFSLGVNLFFELNRKLAQLMEPFTDYEASVEEIHHIHKLDAPSGTAISLAEQLLEHSRKKTWALDQAGSDELLITARREAEVPGTHTISYESSVDRISIEHKAHNREGFAKGAVLAAEWIHGKQGVFTMKDVLFGEG